MLQILITHENQIEFILTSRLLQDALESLFGKLRWMAGNNKSFGALAFKRILRNYILGCGDVIPPVKNSSVNADDEKSGFDDFTGFEKCTEKLVKPQNCKGKVVVSTVLDAEEEMLDYDATDIIHFETELPNSGMENRYFEQCGNV